MNRFLIVFLASSISILDAAEYNPHSPTQQYQANFSRTEEKIKEYKELREDIRGQLALLDMSDNRDLKQPQSDALTAFQAQKEVNRKKCAKELKKLKKDLKKLSKEKKRLESTQID